MLDARLGLGTLYDGWAGKEPEDITLSTVTEIDEGQGKVKVKKPTGQELWVSGSDEMITNIALDDTVLINGGANKYLIQKLKKGTIPKQSVLISV